MPTTKDLFQQADWQQFEHKADALDNLRADNPLLVNRLANLLLLWHSLVFARMMAVAKYNNP
jgi:hypothetical protein